MIGTLSADDLSDDQTIVICSLIMLLPLRDAVPNSAACCQLRRTSSTMLVGKCWWLYITRGSEDASWTTGSC